MADPRIISVDLDEATILRRNADIEQERRVAIFDLIEDNSLQAVARSGRWLCRALSAETQRDRRAAGLGDFARGWQPA